MTQLQGFGALLFGAVTLAFVGALAILFGGPLEITLAAAAMTLAYYVQWSLFIAEFGSPEQKAQINKGAFVWTIGVAVLAAASFLLSVWF